MKSKIFFILILFINIPNLTDAQQTSDSLKPFHFEIIRGYEPTISGAEKIFQNPINDDTTTSKPIVQYSIIPKEMQVKYEPLPIPPAKIKAIPAEKLYKHLAKVGIGTRKTFNAEYYFNSSYSKDYSYGLWAKHLSSSGKIENVGFPGYSDSEITLYGKRIYSATNGVLSGDISFNHNIVHYYGYDAKIFPDIAKNSIKQHFNCISTSISHQSLKIDTSKVNHNISLNYYFLGDHYDTQEHDFSLESNFNKFIGKELVDIFADIHFHNNETSLDIENHALINLKGQIFSQYKNLKFNVGLNIFADIDTTADFNFYPALDLNYNFNNHLIIYAGLEGKTIHQKFRNIINENPFVHSLIPLEATKYKNSLFGGLKGNITTNASYNAKISYTTIENMPFFVLYEHQEPIHTDQHLYQDMHNIFTLIYDTVQLLNPYGEISYHFTEKIELFISGNYYHYTMDNEAYPWHKPDYDITLSSVYNIGNKIFVNAGIFVIGRQYVKNPEFTIDKGLIINNRLKRITDINFGIEYKYSKIISAFLNMYNITNARYYRWQNYQVYGFTVLGGIIFAF